MTRIALVAITILALTLASGTPAAAQIVPPNRNAVSGSLATFSVAPVYSFGAAFELNPVWDVTFAYSFQSAPTTSGNLLGLGARYHFNIPAPGADVYLVGGLASISGTMPGFGTANSTGLFAGAGATLRLANVFTGYLRGSIYALGGTSNAVADVGVQAALAPLVSGQVGYISLAGSGSFYLGVVVQTP